MTNLGDYECRAEFDGFSGDVTLHIGSESLDFSWGASLNYADLLSFGLINHSFTLETTRGQCALWYMGRETEGFFDKFSGAYNARCLEALFVEGALIIEAQGEYHYSDHGGSADGTGKMALFADCVCILPTDSGARRIPLEFVSKLEREGYVITITMDTGESYSVMRMGHETIPFFEKTQQAMSAVKKRWQTSLDGLPKADAAGNGLSALCGSGVVRGLFSPEGGDYWAAGIRDGRAAVELVCGEDAATYLYRFSGVGFEMRLRRAMEAMGTHRQVISLSDAELEAKPLYRMAVARNAHLRFLRSCSAGRIIHTESWSSRLNDFFIDSRS